MPPASSSITPVGTPVEDVVISGLAGRFPESDSVEEFADQLFAGVDMVTANDRRWPSGFRGVPERSGTLRVDLGRFDAQFFGVHARQARVLDPQLRLLLELTHEAIVDAGLDPAELRGSDTAVFVGASCSDAEHYWSEELKASVLADAPTAQGYGLTGCSRSMFANRLSYAFDFHGPSSCVDTACSSSLFALQQAVQALRDGQCEHAVVAGCNLLLKPAVSAQFNSFGMLSPQGECRAFDAAGNGFVRSEAVVVLLLQRNRPLAATCDATASSPTPTPRRCYATVVHAATNTDGHKAEGITFPSGAVQRQLLERVYREAAVDPASVAYVEAHGTGTKVGDPQEANAIAEVLCRDRISPLLIGSVKSNMGHGEPASGLCGVVKVLLAMERGIIPANLHFKEPNPEIPALSDGRLRVVTANTAWEGGLAAVSGFGFGGTNVHVLLRSNPKSKKKAQCLALPRLVVASGRTEQAVHRVLDLAERHHDDAELLALLAEVHGRGQARHPYRGYALVGGSHGDQQMQCGRREVAEVDEQHRRPVWWLFPGMGCQWPRMARDMMRLEPFAKAMTASAACLAPHGVDLLRVVTGDDGDALESLVNRLVAITAVQVALVDVLRALRLEPDGLVGHSLGELGCAYADGCLSAEQAVLASYWRARCVRDADVPRAAMAVVALSWDEVEARAPDGVVAACHNAVDSVSVSGPPEAIAAFCADLEADGICAQVLPSCGFGFHSKYIAEAAPSLLERLETLLPSPARPRGARWKSSAVAERDWDSPLSRSCSAAYFVHNMVSPVRLVEALRHVPADAIIVEVAPSAILLDAVRQTCGPGVATVGLMRRGRAADNLAHLLAGVGKMYNLGAQPHVGGLLPPVRFPVSRGTAMLSPCVGWDHSAEWPVPDFSGRGPCGIGAIGGIASSRGDGIVTAVQVDLSEDEHKYLAGHAVDGRVLFPAAGYMVLVWEAFARQCGKASKEEVAVVMEDVHFHRATVLVPERTTAFLVRLRRGNDDDGDVRSNGVAFEVVESDKAVVTGRIHAPPEHGVVDAMLSSYTVEKKLYSQSAVGKTTENTNEVLHLSTADVYKELRLRGYGYTGVFQGIVESDHLSRKGRLRWSGNWTSFVDAVLQFRMLGTLRGLHVPVRIQRVVLDPRKMSASTKGDVDEVEEEEEEEEKEDDALRNGGGEGVLVAHHDDVNVTQAGGVQIRGLETRLLASRRGKESALAKLETHVYVPYRHTDAPLLDAAAALACAVQVAVENLDTLNVKIVELVDDGRRLQQGAAAQGIVSSPTPLTAANASLTPLLVKIIEDLPELRADATIVVVPPKDDDLQQLATELDELGVKLVLSPGDLLPSASAAGTAHIVVVGAATMKAGLVWQNVADSLVPGGFVLLEEEEESFDAGNTMTAAGLVEVCRLRSCDHRRCLVMLRKVAQASSAPTVAIVTVTASDFSWVEPLKAALAEAAEAHEARQPRVVLLSEAAADAQDGAHSGVLGMANCLFREPGGHNVRVVLVQDPEAPRFDLGLALYADQLTKDLRVNVLRSSGDGARAWGSYRHVPLLPAEGPFLVPARHAYVDALARGDLSSLRWVEGSAALHRPDENVSVYFASVNFKDVMLASGKLPLEARRGGADCSAALPGGQQDCVLGFEFSGRQGGRRVMGIVPNRAMATTVLPDPAFTWEVPDHWTLEQAATVPVCYATAYYALVVRGRMRRGESVLIHCGAGGVGQAAIRIALHAGLTVFTTVGNESKRDFLKRTFSPQLDDAHIANSRDTTFEEHVLAQTAGRGVDLVLNSLAGDLLRASVRCLARHGRFLEIGKYDMARNSALGMAAFLQNAAFHGVMLDDIDGGGGGSVKAELVRLVSEGIESGAVRPLPATVFEERQADQAFRFMASGKHIGKVVLRIKDEEVDTPVPKTVAAVPRAYFHPNKSYVLIGGLGGFGLQLAHWLVSRGARKLVLTSRSGVRTGYQALCVRRWRDAGVDVLVCTSGSGGGSDNGSTEEQRLLARTARRLGPVAGIFNLALVLRDAYLGSLTEDDFAAVCAAKVGASVRLDVATRRDGLCPELDHFVCFSSVVSGRGNAGQANYGFANSSMERLCEARRADGLPGLAIQWGAIGDVGVVAESTAAAGSGGGQDGVVVRGCLPQGIRSCLDAMDVFLRQPHPVVASMVVAARRRCGAVGADRRAVSAAEAVSRILGLEGTKVLASTETLGNLGLDSIMGSEVKLVLERDYDLHFTAKEIRELTLARLHLLAGGSGGTSKTSSVTASTGDVPGAPAATPDTTAAAAARPIPDVENYEIVRYRSATHLIPTDTVVHMPSAAPPGCPRAPVFLVHPVAGDVLGLLPLARRLRRPVFGLQCTEAAPLTSVPDLAAFYVAHVRARQRRGPYSLVGFSFGTCVAFEMALQLERAGERVRLSLLDASPAYVAAHIASFRSRHPDMEAYLLTYFVRLFRPEAISVEIERDLVALGDWEAKLERAISLLRDDTRFSSQQYARAATSLHRKMVIAEAYRPRARFNGLILLVRVTDNYISLSEDYDLSQMCSSPVKLHCIPGAHLEVTTDKSAVEIANLIDDEDKDLPKQPPCRSMTFSSLFSSIVKQKRRDATHKAGM